MPVLWRIIRQLPYALLAPAVCLLTPLALLITDLLWTLFGRRRPPRDTTPGTQCASVVIPNWNGRDLLERYLPSVVSAMQGHPGNEIIVVDNGSTDGSAAYLREYFPSVRVLALERNLGFGGGSNAGFRAARNDIVVLLNSDMRVAPDFLPPLLEAFSDERVFAVSCQIFFSDPAKPREETGLTQAWWAHGALRVRHRIDDRISEPFPCFYAGGGSSAFDRRKFLELGGFAELLRPFYLEDTDAGYRAWKRGWKVLYQPASHVWHEHRGTIGRTFSRGYIDTIVQKNFLLFSWKNIHDLRRLLAHFLYVLSGAWVSWLAGDSLERPSLPGLFRAFLQLIPACAARWRDRTLAVIDDREAFRRPLGGYFRDRFHPFPPAVERPEVLFVSPYGLCPPVHGGGVFMNQTVRALHEHAGVHLLAILDYPWEEAAHEELAPYCKSMHFLQRPDGQPKSFGSLIPFAVREVAIADLEWIFHREILLCRIDVIQLEYTNLGQYAGPLQRIPISLFEHDVYFQSIRRGLRWRLSSLGAFFEYLRALRFELKLLPRLDLIQTCTEENRRYLLEFLPHLSDRIDATYRAGIDVARYRYSTTPREPNTMLFLGSFRHLPNLEALHWFLQHVMPLVLAEEPAARLIIIGSDPPQRHTLPDYGGAVELLGQVEDVREALERYSLFVCPILTGSGVRVKLLEAFAAGIPAVSTTLGAEGLTSQDGSLCALGDTPQEFAAQIIRLLRDPEAAAGLAARGRAYVENERDIRRMTARMAARFQTLITAKRSSESQPS